MSARTASRLALRAASRSLTRPSTIASLANSAAASSARSARPTLVSAMSSRGLRMYSDAAETKSEQPADAAAWEKEKKAAEEKIASLEGKVKDLEKDMQYARAEIQTISRRVTEERQKAAEFGITSFARALLSTSDVLTTALSSVPQPIDPNNKALKQLYDGVELTQRALKNTFAQNNVVPFEKTVGEKFDPNLHEAVFQIPKEVAPKREGGKEWGAGEVFEVQKEGWMIGSRVLRPAQVGVTQME